MGRKSSPRTSQLAALHTAHPRLSEAFSRLAALPKTLPLSALRNLKGLWSSVPGAGGRPHAPPLYTQAAGAGTLSELCAHKPLHALVPLLPGQLHLPCRPMDGRGADAALCPERAAHFPSALLFSAEGSPEEGQPSSPGQRCQVSRPCGPPHPHLLLVPLAASQGPSQCHAALLPPPHPKGAASLLHKWAHLRGFRGGGAGTKQESAQASE